MEHLGGVTESLSVLHDGYRLSSQRSLLNLQSDGLDLSAAEVGWDALSLLHLDDVSWYDCLGINGRPRAVAENDAVSSLHVFKSIKSAISVSILPDGDDSVENENQKDNEGLYKSSHALLTVTCDGNDERNSCGCEQDLDENVIKLLNDAFPERLVLLGIELIGAMLC